MFLKAAAVMFGSRGMKSIAQFARNILVARLLSVEDFGIAATFAIAFTLIEMATDIGINRMIVQDREGNSPKFMATMHGIQLVRGVIGAIVLVALAWPYAWLIGTPELTWAYQLMLFIPLIRGFMHFDIFRAQRDMQFMPIGLTQGLSPLLSILIIAITYMWTPDFRIMLWAVIGQQVIEVALSHLLARRPYRVGFDMVLVRRAISFGVPLMLNGFVMFAMMNGDRMIVGGQLGMEALGLFSAAVLLTLVPATVLSSTQSAVMMPGLSRAQDDPAAFHPQALTCLELTMALGIALALGMSLFGSSVLILAFGAQYAPAADVMILMAVAQAMWICKVGPSTVAVAKGDTKNPLYANLARLAALPLAYLAVVTGGGLLMVAAVAILGEAVGILVSALLLRAKSGVPVERLRLSYALFLLCLCAIVADTLYYPAQSGWLPDVRLSQLVLLALAGVTLLSFGHLRSLVQTRLAKRPSQAPTP